MRPVIGHTIFFTTENNRIGFPAIRGRFPKWECSQLFLLPLNRSWFKGLQTLFQSNNLSKTKKMNAQKRKLTRNYVALLKEFLTLKNEPRLMEEIPSKELNAYVSEFIIMVRKKHNNEDYEPSSLRSLMASFEPYLKRKNSTLLSKALFNRQPYPLQKLR